MSPQPPRTIPLTCAPGIARACDDGTGLTSPATASLRCPASGGGTARTTRRRARGLAGGIPRSNCWKGRRGGGLASAARAAAACGRRRRRTGPRAPAASAAAGFPCRATAAARALRRRAEAELGRRQHGPRRRPAPGARGRRRPVWEAPRRRRAPAGRRAGRRARAAADSPRSAPTARPSGPAAATAAAGAAAALVVAAAAAARAAATAKASQGRRLGQLGRRRDARDVPGAPLQCQMRLRVEARGGDARRDALGQRRPQEGERPDLVGHAARERRQVARRV